MERKNEKKEIMERLYKEMERRYDDIADLYNRLRNEYNDNVPFEQSEEDRIALCAILDIFDGHILD